MVCLMSSFYQKYCLWVTSNFSYGHCQNPTLPNLKYSRVGLKLFWKNSAVRERESKLGSLYLVMMYLAEIESTCFSVSRAQIFSSENPKRSWMNLSPTFICIDIKIGQKSDKGGTPPGDYGVTSQP